MHHADRASRIREKLDCDKAGIFEMLPNILLEVNEVAVVLGSHSGLAMDVAWTGGQPKFDWSGLEDYLSPTPPQPVASCILRFGLSHPW